MSRITTVTHLFYDAFDAHGKNPALIRIFAVVDEYKPETGNLQVNELRSLMEGVKGLDHEPSININIGALRSLSNIIDEGTIVNIVAERYSDGKMQALSIWPVDPQSIVFEKKFAEILKERVQLAEYMAEIREDKP